MHLVEKIAHKVLLINKGEELYNGSLSGIYEIFKGKRIFELQYKSILNEKTLQSFEGAENIEFIENSKVKLYFGENSDIKTILSNLAKLEGDFDITSRKPDLHDIFLNLVKSH